MDAAHDALRNLGLTFGEALKALHAQGQSELACTLAAKAWSQVKEEDPVIAEKMNGLLHLFTGVIHKR